MAMADISWTIESLLGVHSAQIQYELSQKCFNSEEEGELIWKDVNSDALGTPLSYMHSLFQVLALQPGQTVVDIGSGFGNVGHYIGFQQKECQFIGYEIVNERLMEAQRIKEIFQLHNCHYLNHNVGQDFFQLDSADIYFIYDCLTEKTRENIFRRLNRLRRDKPFKLVVVKGTTDILEYANGVNWLQPQVALEWFDPFRIVTVYQSL